MYKSNIFFIHIRAISMNPSSRPNPLDEESFAWICLKPTLIEEKETKHLRLILIC